MLLDDVGNFIRDFGRWPKPNDTHIKEDLLAKKLARGKEEFDEAHLTELQGLPATAAWARVRSFGRFPRRIAMPQTKAEREEGKLWHLLYLQKRVGIPDEVWKDLRSYGAPQPIDSGEALIDDVKAFVREFRRLPQRSHPDKKEAALANKLRKGKVKKCSKPHCRNDAASPRAKFCMGCFKDNAGHWLKQATI